MGVGTANQDRRPLIHDSAEDARGRCRLVAFSYEFSEDVASIVNALSDDLPDSKAEKRPWWSRTIEYIDHVAHAPADALLVSAADKYTPPLDAERRDDAGVEVRSRIVSP